MKMQAAVLERYGQPLMLREVACPEPGPGEALVRVRACGVCGSDLLLRAGGFDSILPIIPGHEASGEVVAVGHGIKRFRVGDRVVVYIYLHCGQCRFCRSGQENICASVKRLGVDLNGAFAEYELVPEENLIPLPGHVGFFEGAVLTDSVATPYHALRRIARLQAGESVAVIGIGGIGSNAVQIAKWLGAYVLAISRKPAKLELARTLGADVVIPLGKDVGERVRGATASLGPDICIQCVGDPAMDKLAMALVRKGGRVVLVGASKEPFQAASVDFIWKELQVLGSRGFTRDDIVAVVKAYTNGILRVDHLLRSVLPLAEVNHALDLLVDSVVPRSVLVPNL